MTSLQRQRRLLKETNPLVRIYMAEEMTLKTKNFSCSFDVFYHEERKVFLRYLAKKYGTLHRFIEENLDNGVGFYLNSSGAFRDVRIVLEKEKEEHEHELH